MRYGPPCGHVNPVPAECEWCNLGINKDPRYGALWWGFHAESNVGHTFIIRGKKGFALGDVILSTALVRDIHAAYPGKYKTMVDTNFRPVWWNNPLVEQADYTKNHQVIDLSYTNGIGSSKQGNKHHFLSWLHKDFERKTGLRVPVTLPKGDLRLSTQEEEPLIRGGRYWVVVAGGKLDMTVKHWGKERYQSLVSLLKPHGIKFVQCGAVHHHHVHPALDDVFSAVGHTENPRDLFALIRHSDGVVCGITGAMHIAACFDKPCVVIAGGREEPWWEAYVNHYYPTAFGPDCAKVTVPHRYLHTVGLLDCCKVKGCWKAKTVPVHANDSRPGQPGYHSLCDLPIRKAGHDSVPQCLDMITPQHVLEAMLSYYEEGILEPPVVSTPFVGLPPIPETLRWARSVSEPVKMQSPEQKAMPKDPGPTAVRKHSYKALDHTAVGGKLTVFVLCYGDHADLARRCIDSIKRTTVPDVIDLRVGLNAVSEDTRSYVYQQAATKIYDHDDNMLKYPLMREMFHDPDHPITSNYIVWFDDDSYITSPVWLNKLAEAIVSNHPNGCRLYGAEFLHDFKRYQTPSHRPELWFKEGTWFTGKHFLAGKQARISAPNGSVIRFVSGGFWAMATHLIKDADIPDSRLLLNGGDIIIGEQVRQAGYKTMSFNRNKELVHSSGHAPRGESRVGAAKRFPWQEGGETR